MFNVLKRMYRGAMGAFPKGAPPGRCFSSHKRLDILLRCTPPPIKSSLICSIYTTSKTSNYLGKRSPFFQRFL